MPIIPEILDYLDELTEIRRDIHAHPELGFTEERTGDRESGQREVFVQDPDGYLLMLAHSIGERSLDRADPP